MLANLEPLVFPGHGLTGMLANLEPLVFPGHGLTGILANLEPLVLPGHGLTGIVLATQLETANRATATRVEAFKNVERMNINSSRPRNSGCNQRVAQKSLRGYNKSNWKPKKLRKIHTECPEGPMGLQTRPADPQ